MRYFGTSGMKRIRNDSGDAITIKDRQFGEVVIPAGESSIPRELYRKYWRDWNRLKVVDMEVKNPPPPPEPVEAEPVAETAEVEAPVEADGENPPAEPNAEVAEATMAAETAEGTADVETATNAEVIEAEAPVAEATVEVSRDSPVDTPAEADPLACPTCGKVCKSAIGLASHVKTHNKEETSQ